MILQTVAAVVLLALVVVGCVLFAWTMEREREP